MKYYSFLVLLISILLGSCNTSTPTDNGSDSTQEQAVVFPNTSFTKAIAYHFEDLNGRSIITDKGELNPTVKKAKELNTAEIDLFLKAINDDNTYGGVYTRCFKPRLGVVFYDKGNPVAHVSICFECSQQHSSPLIQAYANTPVEAHGYSEEGLRKLTGFCRQLGFGQCGE